MSRGSVVNGDAAPGQAQADDDTSTDDLNDQEREGQDGQRQSLRQDGKGNPPPGTADIQIRLNDDPALGFCIFALRRYMPGETLYSERTALEATHDIYKEGNRNVYKLYKRLSPERKRKLHGSFPYLAWANNVDAHEAADARTLITSNLLSKHPVVVDNRLTAADHIRMRPDGARILDAEAGVLEGGTSAARNEGGASSTITSHSSSSNSIDGGAAPTTSVAPASSSSQPGFLGQIKHKAFNVVTGAMPSFGRSSWVAPRVANAPPTTTAGARQETVGWFSRYAFRLEPQNAFPRTGENHQAAVYLLTDLINHRCNKVNNCKIKTSLGKVKVVAERVIEPGDEVTIDYMKEVKDFVCRAECCAGKPKVS